MANKQVIIGVVCIAVIIAAVVIAIKRQSGSGPPERVLQQKPMVKCLILGSDEVVELTLKEWQGLPTDSATGYRKRGNQVLAPAGECPHCGQMIPGCPPAKAEEREYKCPKCGKNVFEEPEQPAPARPKNRG